MLFRFEFPFLTSLFCFLLLVAGSLLVSVFELLLFIDWSKFLKVSSRFSLDLEKRFLTKFSLETLDFLSGKSLKLIIPLLLYKTGVSEKF